MRWAMTILRAVAVVTLWLGCIALLGGSPGFGALGYAIVPAVLLGMTAAIHLLFRHARNGWFIAALLAPLVASVAILVVAAYAYFNAD